MKSRVNIYFCLSQERDSPFSYFSSTFFRIEFKVFCSVDLLTLCHMYIFFSSKLSTCVSKITGCVLLFSRLSKP